MYIYTLMVHIKATLNYRDVFLIVSFFAGGVPKNLIFESVKNANYRYIFVDFI